MHNLPNNINYKRELLKYKSTLAKCKRVKNKPNPKPTPSVSFCPIPWPEPTTSEHVDFVLEKLKQLDKMEPITFSEELSISEGDLNTPYHLLYHGIRFDEDLTKLESIFKCGAIKAGNYLREYYNYYDNCNEGDYVSLASLYCRATYDEFIVPNVSLVINPDVPAYKTIFIPFELWEYLKKSNIKTTNRFSYISGEYHVLKEIPLTKVLAVGINPTIHNKYTIKKVIAQLAKYNLNIPIINIRTFKIIYDPRANEIKR